MLWDLGRFHRAVEVGRAGVAGVNAPVVTMRSQAEVLPDTTRR
jgi:hypothetical protein